MNKFFRTIKSIFTIEELKNRILSTFLLVAVFRLGSYVALPGIDPEMLSVGQAKGFMGLLNAFLGGAFTRASICALGIMPYISASIAVQLLTIMVPQFQKLQREGQSGRNKLNQMTRFLTIALAFAQAAGYLSSPAIPEQALMIGKFQFYISSIILLMGGTMFCVWLGEKITDRGIGNGVSMLIMVNIVSALPSALVAEVLAKGSSGMLILLIELLGLFGILLLVVMFTKAVRRVPVQYAKQITNVGMIQTGQRQYLPFKLNSSGVMPLIFAQSLMFLPSLFASFLVEKSTFAAGVARAFADFTSWEYNLTFAILITLFTFLYTAITINPTQIADDMKRNGGFIPGVQPGKSTASFIDDVLSRVTLPGALFLAFIAILPALANMAGVGKDFCRFYGGSSLLILVGVVLDTLQQVESYLLMRYYEGMMRSGKISDEY